MNKSLDENHAIEELKKFISELESDLPSEIDGKKVSKKSKLPFKLLTLVYSLRHRIIDLSKKSLSLFKDDDYLPSAILIRSIMESASLVFLTQKKIKKVVETKELREIDDFLMKGIFGGRFEDLPVKSTNILTAIDHTDKEYDNYRKMYDEMSEFVHPNWHGTFGLYCEIQSNGKISLGKNVNQTPPKFILNSLFVAITVLLTTFGNLSEDFNEFIRIAELNFDNSKG